jgi:CIC family chloride channel protein
VKLLLLLRVWFRKLPRTTLWIQPAIGGLAVGLMALYLPEVLGVGYDYVERVLGGDLALRTVAQLVVLKIIATATCYSSGNAGGIFGPSLFIGAMIGGAVGSVAHHFFPAITAGPGAYALVGMGAAFAGIIRTPLTSVIMIFELTRDYSIIVPVMIANLISYAISHRLQRLALYEALAHQEGVSLHTLREIGEGRPTVGDVARPLGNTDEAAAVDAMRAAGVRAWPVVREGLLVHMIDAAAAPVECTEFLYPDQPLSAALEKMGAAGIDVLPVLSRAGTGKVLGVLTMPELLAAFGVSDTPEQSA